MSEHCEECGRKISEREAVENDGLCNECFQAEIDEAIDTGMIGEEGDD